MLRLAEVRCWILFCVGDRSRRGDSVANAYVVTYSYICFHITNAQAVQFYSCIPAITSGANVQIKIKDSQAAVESSTALIGAINPRFNLRLNPSILNLFRTHATNVVLNASLVSNRLTHWSIERS